MEIRFNWVRIFILTLFATSCNLVFANTNTCTGTIDTSATVLANGFTHNLESTRNNPSNINSNNINNLRLAYAHAGEESEERRGAPVVTQKTIYTVSNFDVIALDRVTGCQYWKRSLLKSWDIVGGDGARSLYYINENKQGKPAILIAGGNYGGLYAINAKTGELIWRKFVGTDLKNHKITAHPQFYDGKLFVPVSSKEVLNAPLTLVPCCRSHGILRAIDPYTGKFFWSYHTTPDASFQILTGKLGPSGAPLWGSPTIDVARNTVYIGTGQNYSLPITKTSDAIIALDMATGREKWIFQSTKNDAWNAGCNFPKYLDLACPKPAGADLDFGAAPMLIKRRDGTQAVYAGAKNGAVYALNPDTGALLWSKRLGEGSNLGGIHWGMAADAKNIYVGISDVIVNKLSGIAGLNFGDNSAKNMSLTPNAKPGVYALDLLTGSVIWEKHPKRNYEGKEVAQIYSASLSVTNDVVFAPSLDGFVRAFRASDGREVWNYDTVFSFNGINGVKGNGGTIDQVGVVPAGDNILINSGYDHFGGTNAYQAGKGNGLFVLKLAGTR